MKIKIGSKFYDKLKGCTFAPVVDLAGTSLPTNSFSVEIVDDEDFVIGSLIYLYDNLGNRWAAYELRKKEQLGRGMVRLTAESWIRHLGFYRMPPAMYSSAPLVDVMEEIFGQSWASIYDLDQSFQSATISGYLPEQNLRDRMTWIWFVIGAYVQDFFTDRIMIRPLAETETEIPEGKTFWKPNISTTDVITAISGKYYSYTQGTPQTGEKSVTVGGVTYIEEETIVTLSNPDAPVNATENNVNIDGITIINQGNISGILSWLAEYYFYNQSVTFDCINNGEFLPGEKCTVYLGDCLAGVGHIESTDYSFGLQARSKVKMTLEEIRELVPLRVQYFSGNRMVDQKTYHFPAGTEYEIENHYIDATFFGHRHIFRPLNAAASGTMGSSETINVQYVEDALDLDLETGELMVASVDGITSEGVIS